MSAQPPPPSPAADSAGNGGACGGKPIALDPKTYKSRFQALRGELDKAIEAGDPIGGVEALQQYKRFVTTHLPPGSKARLKWKYGIFKEIKPIRRLMAECRDRSKHRESFEALVRMLEGMSKSPAAVLNSTCILEIRFLTAQPGGLPAALKVFEKLKRPEYKVKLKRRHYSVLLDGCRVDGDAQTAWSLVAEMKSKGLQTLSKEISTLLGLATAPGQPPSSLQRVLDMMIADVGIASLELIEALRRAVSAPQSGFVALREACIADIKGNLKPPGDGETIKLSPFRLDAKHRDAIMEALKADQVARAPSPWKAKQTAEAFDKFGPHIDSLGPCQVLIDAANVGHFDNHGAFSFVQADNAYQYFAQRYPTKLIISDWRARSARPGSRDHAILQSWINAKCVVVTSSGTNDDSFWLYAAAWLTRDQSQVYIVTNDILRDHHLSIDYNMEFFRFVQSHSIRFRCPRRGQKRPREPETAPQQRPRLTFHFPFVAPFSPARLPDGRGVAVPYFEKHHRFESGTVNEVREVDVVKQVEDGLPILHEKILQTLRWAVLIPSPTSDAKQASRKSAQ